MSKDLTSTLISKFGPSPQDHSNIQQIWFGTLIGQATVAVGMVIVYLLALGLLNKTVGTEFAQMQKSNPWLF